MFYRKTNMKIYGCCYKVPYDEVTLCHYMLANIKVKKILFGYKIKGNLYFSVYSSNNYKENWMPFEKREDIFKNNKMFFNKTCLKTTFNEKIKNLNKSDIKETVYKIHFNSMVLLDKFNREGIKLGLKDKRKPNKVD